MMPVLEDNVLIVIVDDVSFITISCVMPFQTFNAFVEIKIFSRCYVSSEAVRSLFGDLLASTMCG